MIRHWGAKFSESIKTGANRHQCQEQRAELVSLCSNWLPADVTPVPKLVVVILTMNYILLFVLYCNLISAFVGQYIELKT